MIDFNDARPIPPRFDLDAIVARLRESAECWVPWHFPKGRRDGDDLDAVHHAVEARPRDDNLQRASRVLHLVARVGLPLDHRLIDGRPDHVLRHAVDRHPLGPLERGVEARHREAALCLLGRVGAAA